ncbi:MAG: hypothetical protein ACI9YB_001768, partial [Halioglobus sp.]
LFLLSQPFFLTLFSPKLKLDRALEKKPISAYT